MHKQIYDHGESNCQQSAVQETDRINISSEHDRIHFHSTDNISVQKDSEYSPCQHADEGKDNILPVHIGRNFSIIESQHLQGCQFSLALRNIDIVQILQNHKSKHSRRNDQHYDYRIQCSKHSVKLSLQTAGIADA